MTTAEKRGKYTRVNLVGGETSLSLVEQSPTRTQLWRTDVDVFLCVFTTTEGDGSTAVVERPTEVVFMSFPVFPFCPPFLC